MFSSRLLSAPIRLVECPRDAMQGLPHFIPTEHKIRFLNALMRCGFYAIDCASFVSPRAVPQMRDSAEVLAGCDRELLRGPKASKLSVVIASMSGLKRALDTPIVSIIGFPLSCCERFQQLNTKRSIEMAFEDIKQMKTIVAETNEKIKKGSTDSKDIAMEKELIVYLSMAFGNPYGEKYDLDIAEQFATQLVSLGVRTISLADTVGIAKPHQIYDLFIRLHKKFPDITFGAHLHSNTVTSEKKVVAALDAGCKMIDSALGGMGGCPFTEQHDLVGNVATELVLRTLEERNLLPLSLNQDQTKECVRLKQEIFGITVKDMLLSQSLRDEKLFAQLCQEHFKAYDTEGKGVLDYNGFRASMLNVFAELGRESPSEEKIASSFNKVDVLKLGCITLDAYMLGARRILMKRASLLEASTK